MILEILGLVFSIFLLVKLVQDNGKHGKLPPGPWGFPLVGHLPLLGVEPHKTLLNWSKNYGPLIYCRFGSFKTVVFNDAKLIKQCFSMSETAGRADIPALITAAENHGILLSSGPNHTEQRTFALRNLKDQGMGKKTMESTIQEDLEEFLQKMKEKEGTPIASSQLFTPHVINSLWAIVMSTRLDPTKSAYFSVLAQEKIARLCSLISQLAMYMPWIERLVKMLTFGNVILCKDRVNAFRELYSYAGDQVEEHASTWAKNQPRDVTDAYLDKVDDTNDHSSSFHKSHGAISKFVGDLFLAGVETTSTSLEWSLNYLARYPKVQKKLQEEIDSVVGHSRSPSFNDKATMPYTDAILYELLRMSSILPLGTPHRALHDFTFQGYHIPKGAMLMPNVYACSYDPDVWGDPEVFRPERWLGPEGSKLKSERFITFGSGKRVCVGEALARDQIWLYLTTVFQRFNVVFDGPTPPLVANLGLVLNSKPFKVIFKSRTET